MKKLSLILAVVIFFSIAIAPQHSYAEDSAGFTFPDLTPGMTSYTFTYHNLTGSPVGVVGIETPGINWAEITSSSCNTSRKYNPCC